MATVKDPYKFITDHLNQNQSKLRSLLSQMNAKKNGPGNNSSNSPRKVTMSPYEKIMLRQLTQDKTPERYTGSPVSSSPGSREGTPTAKRTVIEQNGHPLSSYRVDSESRRPGTRVNSTDGRTQVMSLFENTEG